MSNEKIRLVNQGLSLDANAMLMMREFANADKATKHQHAANQSTLTPKDGIKIYIKAVQKLATELEQLKVMTENYNKKKNASNFKVKDEARKIHLEMTLKTNSMMEIIEEFIQAFAVVHDLDAKDFMSLLYYRFTFIKDNLDLLFITNKISYVNDIKIVLNRLVQTFEKMLESLETASEDESSNLTDEEKTQLSV
jgi:hypothetical protein